MKIGIAGAGTMSASMALIFLEQGYDTILHVRSERSMDRARGIIGVSLTADVRMGRRTQEEADTLLKQLRFTTEVRDLADRDLVIESIVEDLETKQEYWERVSYVVSDRCVLATNTSGLSINEISARVKGRNRFLGMHWFNPAHLIPLIEVIRCDQTDERSTQLVFEVARSIGKKPVLCRRDVPGFIANRIQFAVLRECMDMAEHGVASIEDIDAVMKYGLGFRYAAFGPFEVADFGGLDTFYHISEYLNGDLCNTDQPQKLLADHYKRNEYGVKTRRGFYDYSDGADIRAVERRDRLFSLLYQTLYETE